MSNLSNTNQDDATRLVVAIVDFLRDQLEARSDFVPEDTDCLEIAIQCLEMAYGLDANGYLQYRFARPLIDIFDQVVNPVSVRDKLRAEALKDEGNEYMRRSMYPAAEDAYSRAIELDKWNSIYFANRAGSRIEQRNFFEAISDCRQALLLNPDYAKAHAKMGQAYALIHRPREAARCYRQALELEPDNERYRNNLSAAEGQISRPDAVGLLTSVLNSIFGMSSLTSTNNDDGVSFPPSFMLITEQHPPTRSNEQAQQSADTARESSIESNTVEFPPRYGIFDEGTEEQSPPEFNIPPELQSRDESDDPLEFSIDIPLFALIQDHPDDCSCQRPATTGQTGEQVDITNDIRTGQEQIAAITSETEGDIANQLHTDTTEISESDKASKDTKLTTPPEKIASESTGQEPTMVEKTKDEPQNGERNAVWIDVTDSVESLVTTVESDKNLATTDKTLAEDSNKTAENSKTNSGLKDGMGFLESVVTDVHTAGHDLISADGKQSEKKSGSAEEVGKNPQSKNFRESETLPRDKNLATTDTKLAEDFNKTAENSKTNSGLKDGMGFLESVVTDVQTAGHDLLSADGKQSEKNSGSAEEVQNPENIEQDAETDDSKKPLQNDRSTKQ